MNDQSRMSGDQYRLFGVEMSPYSVKVRSYMRYKQIDHEWVVRSMDRMAEFGKYAKLPLVPCLAFPDGSGMQDSTPIMEKLEVLHGNQFQVRLDDPALDFLAVLIEEYADEWVNKPMFHYRWFYDANAKSAALRIALETVPPGSPREAAQQMAAALEARMVPRLSFVGSGRDKPEVEPNARLIEKSFHRLAGFLEPLLAKRSYLFGGRPTMADFGLYGQLKELLSDPTPGEYLRAQAPHVCHWITRMEDPRGVDEILPVATLVHDFTPLLREEIAGLFLPWSDANARALAEGKAAFTVRLEGHDFTQETQKYHAKSLAELRRKYAKAADHQALRVILADTGCLPWLEA